MPKLEHYTTTLEKIFHLTPTVRTFRLRYPGGKGFSFKPGQFCMVDVPAGDKIKKKAYSIASPPHELEYIDLCVKLVEEGLATHWFWSLKEGDSVDLGGPYGGFVLPDPIETDLVFVATGTGLAPFRSMIRTLYQEASSFDRQASLIFGVRYEDEILYHDEWCDLAKANDSFQYIPTISRPKDWGGQVGYVQEALKKHMLSPSGKQIYICGLIPMIEAVEKAALEIGCDPKQIHFEKYV